jgi:hypothetical protein
VYSLVNAPTIGYDLARTPTGASVATVLLEALAVQSDFAERAVEAFDPDFGADPRRASAWLEVSALTPPTRLDDALAVAREVVDDAARTMRLTRGQLDPIISELTTACFGGLNDLLRLVRSDILDEMPAHVVAMASDAVAAAYGGRRLGDDVRHLLGAPWIAAARSLPAIPADLGPFRAEVGRVLDRIPLLTAAQAAKLSHGIDVTDADWSRRMHAAAWAAYLSGRLRPAASAQFQAVRGLRAAGVDAAAAARGVWNAVSGCLQAVALHDLLDEVTYGVLVAPWENAMGILG